MPTIIAYAYDADYHCTGCTRQRYLKGTLTQSHICIDEHGLPELIYREGNPVHPVFSTDENAYSQNCGTCGDTF